MSQSHSRKLKEAWQSLEGFTCLLWLFFVWLFSQLLNWKAWAFSFQHLIPAYVETLKLPEMPAQRNDKWFAPKRTIELLWAWHTKELLRLHSVQIASQREPAMQVWCLLSINPIPMMRAMVPRHKDLDGEQSVVMSLDFTPVSCHGIWAGYIAVLASIVPSCPCPCIREIMKSEVTSHPCGSEHEEMREMLGQRLQNFIPLSPAAPWRTFSAPSWKSNSGSCICVFWKGMRS